MLRWLWKQYSRVAPFFFGGMALLELCAATILIVGGSWSALEYLAFAAWFGFFAVYTWQRYYGKERQC